MKHTLVSLLAIAFWLSAGSACANAQGTFSIGGEFENNACTYELIEQTEGLPVSVRGDGLILRAPKDGTKGQQWLIYPDQEGGNKFRFMTLSNGEFMSVNNTGGVIRWAKNGDQGQLFEFKNISPNWPANEKANGWSPLLSIMEGTKGEFLSSSPAANLRRWSKSGGKDQLFKLHRLKCADQKTLKLPAIEKNAGQIPSPKMESPLQSTSPSDIPTRLKEYVVAVSVLSALVVNDSNFTDKKEQFDTSPLYVLVHKQYWDRSQSRGTVKQVPPGGLSEAWKYSIQRGFSKTDMTTISKTVGWEISGGAEVNASATKGQKDVDSKSIGAKANLAFKYSESQTTTNQSGQTTSEAATQEYTTTLASTGKEYTIAVWSLVDKFELFDSYNRPVSKFESVDATSRQTLWFPDDNTTAKAVSPASTK